MKSRPHAIPESNIFKRVHTTFSFCAGQSSCMGRPTALAINLRMRVDRRRLLSTSDTQVRVTLPFLAIEALVIPLSIIKALISRGSIYFLPSLVNRV